MTRGNQRDKAREKNAAKNSTKGARKDGLETLTPQQRREHDAKALAEKLAKKAASKDI